MLYVCFLFFFSSRRRHTRGSGDWSSDVCSSDLLYPQWAEQLEGIAKRIFAMPHVEIASHSYSHPFFWEPGAAPNEDDSKEVNLNLHIPGYQMDMNREINGSVDYIRKRLEPPGKPVDVFLWTGNTPPLAHAPANSHDAGPLYRNCRP